MREVIRCNAPDFVCLAETKLNEITLDIISSILPHGYVLICIKNALHAAGGFLVGIKQNSMSCNVLQLSFQFSG